MQNLSEWKPGTHRKVFLCGKPKSAGKTWFAMSAPGQKLVLQYDLGSPSIPKDIVDPSTISYQSYEAADVNMVLNTDKWKRPTNVGGAIIRDIQAVKEGFKKGGPVVIDGQELELPDTIVLDGLTEMTNIVVDWILAVNNKTSPDDFDNKYAIWTKRIDVVRNILHAIIPLPANIILIAHEVAEMKDNKPTGSVVPDIGGKLDNMVAGKVDAAIRCYASFQGSPQYRVQVQPDGVREWIGIRGAFGLPKDIDVTITPANKVLPWDRVFKA